MTGGVARLTLLAAMVLALVGCRSGGERLSFRRPLSPADAGYHTNNLLDLSSQADADSLGSINDQTRAAERIRRKPSLEQLAKRRSVLCLSGGGSYGAFSAGVLCGWTTSGDRPGVNSRPNFSVVTGISTGALIAPYAFLGPQYDEAIRRFYTTIEDRDIYRLRPVRGLFSEALADNTPLANLIDRSLTPQIIQEVGEEHRKAAGSTSAPPNSRAGVSSAGTWGRSRPATDRRTENLSSRFCWDHRPSPPSSRQHGSRSRWMGGPWSRITAMEGLPCQSSFVRLTCRQMNGATAARTWPE
jgi:hypothetical protein